MLLNWLLLISKIFWKNLFRKMILRMKVIYKKLVTILFTQEILK